MRVYVCFHNISWLRKVAFHRTIMGTQGVHEIMQRIKLTPGRIASAVCPDGKQQAFLRDSEQPGLGLRTTAARSEEHTSELQSLMRNSYAVFCLQKKKTQKQ